MTNYCYYLKVICLVALIGAVRCQDDDGLAYPSPPQMCTDSPTAMPRQIELDDPPTKFINIEHGMQIFLDYQIPCQGYITEFRFLSSETVIWGLHLAIFRPAFINGYRLVNQLYLNGFSTNVLGDTWVIARPRDPIPVREGDLVGMFYDEFNVSTGQGRASIRSLSMPFVSDLTPRSLRTRPHVRYTRNINALVFTRNADGMIVNKTVLYEHEGVLTYREPALYVMLSKFASAGGFSAQDIRQIVSGPKQNTSTSSGTNAPGIRRYSDEGLMFRDLKCNLYPRLDLEFTRTYCGNQLSVRYYYDIADRQCKQFLGCETGIRRSQTTPAMLPPSGGDTSVVYTTESSWSNNFPTKPMCQLICQDARDLLGPAKRRALSQPVSTTLPPPAPARVYYKASLLMGPS